MPSHNIEHDMANSSCADSFWVDQPIPLTDFLVETTMAAPTAVASSSPHWVTVSNARLIRFRFDSTSSSVLRLNTCLPGQYDPVRDALQLILVCRKYDAASAEENADLMLQAGGHAYEVGEIDQKLAAAAVPAAADMIDGGTTVLSLGTAQKTLPAASNAFQFRAVVLDFSYGILRSGSTRLKPGDGLWFRIAPNEQVGVTDMSIDIISAMLRYRSNATLHSQRARDARRVFRA